MNDKYLSVSVINRYIKHKLDTDDNLQQVFIKGEISNFKAHSTGHLYFSIKDETSKINAIMFAKAASNLNFNPVDGTKVLITGRISVYEATGNYQIYVDEMQEDGLGNLYIEFEKLKKKLESEGLFDSKYKKPIPKYPSKIGVITANTGAAIKDILTTIKRRYPIAQVILFPSLVQGEGAKDDIVRQIKKADTFNLDTLIVGRGGGSIEDLWAFNEEIVARAIFECKTPVISAVGHEIDFTIADFVADLRAPTPTGAAEMAVPTILDVQNVIDGFTIRLNKNIKNMVNQKFIMLRNFKNSYVLKNPMSMYEIKEQKLDNLIESLKKDLINITENKKNKFNHLIDSYVLKNPLMILDKPNKEFNLLLKSLELLNPLGILDKGYSVVKIDDKVVNSVKMVKKGNDINIRVKDGTIKANVMEVEK